MPQLHLLSPLGFRASGVAAGIKSKRGALDIGLLVCDSVATAAAAFTTNKVFAAPIAVGREHIASGKLRGIVVNSGNANACTGTRGVRDARRMCELAGRAIGASGKDFLPSSTGIIGHLLPMEKIERGIVSAARALGDSAEHAMRFCDAIMTTDTKRKTASTTFKIGKQRVTIAGVCKGAGMIGPRVAVASGALVNSHSRAVGVRTSATKALHATMLAYLTTDAAASSAVLRKLLAPSVGRSFNAVTVDDHTSTNDTVAILASGASGGNINSIASAKNFLAAMSEVCQSLAHQIAADGEGATKVVTINVRRAASDHAAHAMARAIANSPLVKCAMNGNDPNWGRIVSAAGLAGVTFDPDRCVLTLQGTIVFRAGQPVKFDAVRVSKSLDAKEVAVDLDCRGGEGAATVYTCDLSKEYVAINADYHT